MRILQGAAMRTIKKWEEMRSFAGSLIAYECDLRSTTDNVVLGGKLSRFGIVSKFPSVVTGGGEVGFFLSRLINVVTIDDSFQLTQSNLNALNFQCRVVSFEELRSVIALRQYDLAKFERRSRGSSLAFLQKFGQEIGVNLEDNDT